MSLRGDAKSRPVPTTRAAQAHYDRWAGAYGRSRMLPSLQKKALAELRPCAGDRVLDIACGAGASRCPPLSQKKPPADPRPGAGDRVPATAGGAGAGATAGPPRAAGAGGVDRPDGRPQSPRHCPAAPRGTAEAQRPCPAGDVENAI